MSSAVRWRFPHSRGASWALAGLVVASGFWGLARVNQGNLPELLQVQEVSPLEVEVGGHIEVSGRGFPQGRVAEVTFRGTLHRPGKDPVQRAEIRTEGTVLGPNHIEVPYSPELESQFCGAGEEQVHTTFDGAVLVSFPSAVAGAPPVVGTLSHATLDLRPLVRHKSVQDARKSAGARTVRDLGLELAEDEPTPLGLRIETVMPHSRADDIGLSAGDSLEKVDGVRVHGVEDVLPRGNKAFAELALRRQGDGAPFVKHVRLGGMASQSPSDLVVPSAVLLLLFASVLFAFAPPVGPLAWVERRMAASLASLSRGRPARRKGGKVSVGVAVGSARGLLPSARRIGKASLAWLVVPPAVFLGFDLDIGIVYLVLALLSVLLAGAAAVGGSKGPNGRPSFRSGAGTWPAEPGTPSSSRSEGPLRWAPSC